MVSRGGGLELLSAMLDGVVRERCVALRLSGEGKKVLKKWLVSWGSPRMGRGGGDLGGDRCRLQRLGS